MNSRIKKITLGIVLLVIVGVIYYLESQKPARIAPENAEIKITEPFLRNEQEGNGEVFINNPVSAERILAAPDRSAILSEKAKKYLRAREIVNPHGFINTPPMSSGQAGPITIADIIGKKIILVDFWTYSCINCQRTTPYLNSWYGTYEEMGLEIIGVHTPEFEFEKEYSNVLDAVKKFNIQYPVVLDNDYSTWTAYNNRYWPRKYLIDIDGFIIYDHIGEGAYEETEKKIHALLAERAEVFGVKQKIAEDMVRPEGVISVDFTRVKSPETYFGASRNKNLGNGVSGLTGVLNFSVPSDVGTNSLYLGGNWNIQSEFAENRNDGAKIIFRYDSKDVYFVASSEAGASIKILRDGKPLTADTAGADVVVKESSSEAIIQEDRLYKLIQDKNGYGEHTLEIIIENPGLKAFTFTFG
ncbi:MAG: hypothetical protein A2934_05440 [Candidatus Sungbacteria bacterium RIFCSPLOWO2_01_FULL_47_10]|uniref:Thioredoxin domain-containing protein n=1 Tax=Candidatus Sungbacteria bacterium RIFCSPLOWO2_01_FULL_47_10 TaxID=1802276 RepID=A0A1G2L1T3_9BACT|nr:MAG: hypothetical protein A2934_05440 [Candidatus Sungbacteria bacterium RIFCSPLOWO2_01_FULL_47_10]